MKLLPFTVRVESLVKFLLLLALVAMVLFFTSHAYNNYRIRQRVAAGVNLAIEASAVVTGNACKGLALNSGWISPESSDGVVVSISKDTGVVTITFGSDIEGGGRTLTWVPVPFGGTSLCAASSDSVSPYVLSSTSRVAWLCGSANTISRNPAVLLHKGTLPSKYTPLVCRW